VTAAPTTDRAGGRPWGALLPEPVELPLAEIGRPRRAQTLEEHLATYGPRPLHGGRDSDVVIDRLAAAGLTGRGGGHFPAARKWQAVRDTTAATGRLPLVVGNAAEGEPAIAKDAALLSLRPHLVLDGLAVAAETLDATECVLWLHDDAGPLWRRVENALDERADAGLVERPVRLVAAPARYLSGEATAVVRALSGGPALPELRDLPAAFDGVHGRPTLVQNTETLARVAVLARSAHRPGPSTSLVTVVADGRRVVAEVPDTSTVATALEATGALGAVPAAILLGGYGGQWLPWSTAHRLPIGPAALRAAGHSLGAGLLAVLPAGACGVAETAALVRYLAASGARQCGPCLFGLDALAATTTDLARGAGGRTATRRLTAWAAEIAGRGACNHPDGVIRMLRSALVTFADDVAAHAAGRPCAAAGRPPLLPTGDGAS
jgi:NADH:ubiquinone oxidoreductase subunit F (NADH-binding)